jgi:hypothetical protein
VQGACETSISTGQSFATAVQRAELLEPLLRELSAVPFSRREAKGDTMAADRGLRISGNKRLIDESFDEWHDAPLQRSEKIGSATQIAGTDVRFKRIARHKEKWHLDFWVGSSAEAAVQLNQPGTAGSENPGTTLAVDARRRRYIVRQGMLTGNPPSDRIDEKEFRRRTGLTPSDVTVGGKPAKKEWHVVARLDDASGVAIRDATAEFVRRCWNARTFGR